MTLPVSQDLEQVARLLDHPRPQVVVVVGAGVAINATGQPHATWLGLLKHGIRHLVQKRFQPQWGAELEATLEAAFAPFQLPTALQHAELVEQALTTPDEKAFAQWLESAFARFTIRDDPKARATIEALRNVREAGALLLTTNYDSLLSDATGVPPVTWEERANFHRVMTRQKPGILHVHGHWQRPSSIVLGRTSYNRVVADDGLQQLLKTLWLNWTWVYVGCGDGLDDPNLGRLLEWSRGWGVSALPDFFLARADKADEIAKRPGKPSNLVSIGYPTHEQLSTVLEYITPAARCWPFMRVDDEFPLFRVPGSQIPFPARQEYLEGDVPRLAVDAELQSRLALHGWACVLDEASVGKTTLALRAATTPAQRAHPVFYLDLKSEILDDEDASPASALQRLARPGALLILDNVHHQPELARRLWQQWNAKPRDGRGQMLLVATRIHQPVVTTPEEDLVFFERHPINPALLLHLTAEDLGRVAKHIYRRVAGTAGPAMPEPPPRALAEWHRDYRAALNAFTFAVMNRLAEFRRGNWELPLSAAASWVRQNWLEKLDPAELENAVCLAAFGAQELEILVRTEALPHPGKLRVLQSELCLVTDTPLGAFGQYHQYSLREPGWGRLLLAALEPAPDEEQLLLSTAVRYPLMGLIMSRRWKSAGLTDRSERLWGTLAANQAAVAAKLWDLPLSNIKNLLRAASVSNQAELTLLLWRTIESNPGKLAARAWESSLESIGAFLRVGAQQQRNVKLLVEAILGRPDEPDRQAKLDRLADSARHSALGSLASVLDIVQQSGSDTTAVWDAIEKHTSTSNPEQWATSLEAIDSFLDVAERHGRDIDRWWGTFFGDPAAPDQPAKLSQFAKMAWASSLEVVGSFLEMAKQHGRNTDRLWDVLESQPEQFAACAWACTLDRIGSFFDVATRHERSTARFEEALQREPARLAAKGVEASFAELVGFAHYCPPKLFELALSQVQSGHWKDTAPDEVMTGASWLIGHCRKVNRNELADELTVLLLARANWRDFPPQSGGFAQACWLLAHTPSSLAALTEHFLEVVCSEKWLGVVYAVTGCGQLASGLRTLALYQTAQRCQQFHHPGLGWRLNQELGRLAVTPQKQQPQIIQFLGCAAICGWAVSRQSVVNVDARIVAHLPCGVAPHRPGATKIEDHPLQLWLGLRAFVSITGRRLSLPRDPISDTLELWRVNLAETAPTPDSTAHRINQSMVTWLESCLRASPPALVPAREPLWTLADFSDHPQVRITSA